MFGGAFGRHEGGPGGGSEFQSKRTKSWKGIRLNGGIPKKTRTKHHVRKRCRASKQSRKRSSTEFIIIVFTKQFSCHTKDSWLDRGVSICDGSNFFHKNCCRFRTANCEVCSDRIGLSSSFTTPLDWSSRFPAVFGRQRRLRLGWCRPTIA